MNNRYRLFRRGCRFYLQDNETRQQTSLRTSDPREAQRLLSARNESVRAPLLNLSLARAYLAAQDPGMASRTWKAVMEETIRHGQPVTQERYTRAARDRAFDSIRDKPLIQTTADDLLRVLRTGGRCTNHFLRRLHNLALGLGWLLAPVLHSKQWPKISPKSRRAIQWEEHCRLVETESDPERALYYEVLWETGGSQSDVVMLKADSIDWNRRLLIFRRAKLSSDAPPAQLAIGPRLEGLLRKLPARDLLFPRWSKTSNKDRAAEFRRRCRILKMEGISLHSYRYAWAERAFALGYPERFAMANLGHSSRAVHRAYARKALVVCPPLESFGVSQWQRDSNGGPSAPTPGVQEATGTVVGTHLHRKAH